jgi:potassium-transporting ATPase KdpC subunit
MIVPGDSPAEDQITPLPPQAVLRQQWQPALRSVMLLTLTTGVVFPLALALLAQLFFPFQSEGSLVKQGGIVLGSDLIGQNFTAAGYFHPRPSAAGKGYETTASAGSNLGPTNPKLRADVQKAANEYRRENNLAPDAMIPLEAVTNSGSGLDPDISPADAALQVPRIAKARPSLSEEQIRRLVAEHTQGRQLGFLGEPRVPVLALNLALDQLAPLPAAP